MPVPSSYNDLTTNPKLRDFVGDVWYQKFTIIPNEWEGKKVFIRVGSASHNSKIWINGNLVKEYIGGFLPFEVDITNEVKYGQKNNIVICVNNEL
jgi:beta-glucuronidase